MDGGVYDVACALETEVGCSFVDYISCKVYLDKTAGCYLVVVQAWERERAFLQLL